MAEAGRSKFGRANEVSSGRKVEHSAEHSTQWAQQRANNSYGRRTGCQAVAHHSRVFQCYPKLDVPIREGRVDCFRNDIRRASDEL